MKCSLCGNPADLIEEPYAPYGRGPKGKLFYKRCTRCKAETRKLYGNNYTLNAIGNIYSEADAKRDTITNNKFKSKEV